MAGDNIKVTKKVDVRLTQGQIDVTDLPKAIERVLASLRVGAVNVSPDIKVDKRAVEKLAKDLGTYTNELAKVARGQAEQVSDAWVNQFREQGFISKKGRTALKRGLAASVVGINRDMEAAISTVGKTNVTKRLQERVAGLITGGKDGVDFRKLSSKQQAEIAKVMTTYDQTVKQLSTIERRAASVTKRLEKEGSAVATDKVIPPQQLDAIAAERKRLQGLLKGLQSRTDIDKLYQEERKAQERLAKDQAAAIKENKRIEDQQRSSAEKSHKQKISDEARRAKELQAARDKIEAASRAKIGKQAFRDVGGFAGLTAGVPQLGGGTRAFIKEHLQAQLKTVNAELARLKTNLGGLAEGDQRFVAMTKRADQLAKALKDVSRTAKKTSEDLKDRTAQRALRGRYIAGRETVKSAGGLEGVRNIPREQLRVAADYLEASLQRHTAAAAKLERRVGGTTSAAYKKLNVRIQKTADALHEARVRMSGFGTASQQTSALLRQFFRYAIGYGALYKMIQGFQQLTGAVVDLDRALVSIKAITDATDKEMLTISTTIKRVALTTKFTTTEISKAAQVLSQAGTEAEDFPEALSSVALFASATESSIETAADLISTMRNVFDELDDITIANQLTKAVNISKLTADDLKTILSLGSQTARSFNLTSEQFLAAATTMRNAGIKASTVATGLRQGLIEIFNPDTKTVGVLAERYRELGEKMSEEQIKGMLFGFTQGGTPLVSALRELQRIGFGGSGAKTFQRTFDVRAENAIKALIADLGQLEEAEAKLTFGNAALKASETQMTSLKYSVDNLGAALTVLADSLGRDAVRGLEKFTDAATDAVTELTDLNDSLQSQTGVGIGAVALGGLTAGAIYGATGKTHLGKLAKFSLGTYAGTYLASESVDLAKGAGVESSTGAKLAAFAPAALEFAAIMGLFSGLKDRLPKVDAKKFTASTTVLGKTMGWFSSIGKVVTDKFPIFGRLASLLSPWAKIATIGSVIYAAWEYFSPDSLEDAKTKVAGATKEHERAKKQKQELDSAFDQFSITEVSGIESAGAGTTAEEVLRVEDMIRRYRQGLSDLFNLTAEEQADQANETLQAVQASLLTLSTEGADSGTQLYKDTIKKLQDIASTRGGLIPDAKSLVDVGAIQRGIETHTKSIATAIVETAVKNLEIEGELSVFDQAFREAFADLSSDPVYEKLLTTLQGTPEEMSNLYRAMFDGLKTHSQAARDAADRLVENTLQKKVTSIVNLLATEDTDEGRKKILAQQVGAAHLLGESGIAFLDMLIKAVDTATASMQEEIKTANLAAGAGAVASFARRLTGEADPAGRVANLQSVGPVLSRQRRAAEIAAAGGRESKEKQAKDILDRFLRLASDQTFQAYRRGSARSGKEPLLKAAEEGKIDLTADTPEGLRLSDNIKSLRDYLNAYTASVKRSNEKAEKQYLEDVLLQKQIHDADVAILDAKKNNKYLLASMGETNPLLVKATAEQLLIADEMAYLGRKAYDQLAEKEELEQTQNEIAKLGLKHAQVREKAEREIADNADALDKAYRQQAIEMLKIKSTSIARQYKEAAIAGNTELMLELSQRHYDLFERRLEIQDYNLQEEQEDAAYRAAKMEEAREGYNSLASNVNELAGAYLLQLRELKEVGPTTGDPERDAEIRARGEQFPRSAQHDFYSRAAGASAGALGALEKFTKTEEFAGLKPETAKQILDIIKDLTREAEKFKQLSEDTSTDTIWEQIKEGFDPAKIAEDLEKTTSNVNNLGKSIRDNLIKGMDDVGDAFAKAIVDGENLGNSLKAVFRDVAKQIVATLIKAGINKLIGAFLGVPSGAAKGKANVEGYAGGGKITGPGTGTSDDIPGIVLGDTGKPVRPILVSNGESILTAAATKALGEDFINSVNAGRPLKAAAGAIIRESRNTTSSAKSPMMAGSQVVEYTHAPTYAMENGEDSMTADNLRRVSKMIDDQAKRIISQEQRHGGLLYKNRG